MPNLVFFAFRKLEIGLIESHLVHLDFPRLCRYDNSSWVARHSVVLIRLRSRWHFLQEDALPNLLLVSLSNALKGFTFEHLVQRFNCLAASSSNSISARLFGLRRQVLQYVYLPSGREASLPKLLASFVISHFGQCFTAPFFWCNTDNPF